ncbi:MAG: S16 family serine protease [Candidatus Korarchaeum sp.]
MGLKKCMSRKVFLVLLMAVIILPYLPSTAERSKAFLKVPAVYQSPDGTLAGTLGNLTVEVEKGEGIVYFSADPLTQIDTQGAARTAALVASYILNVDPRSLNFYYRLESGSTIVGGPSAGAAMTIATVAAILGKQVRGDTIMTGMINLDGTIGPVGGIPQKLQAAAEAGAKVFLLPAGQEIVEEAVPKQVRVGPLVITTVERRKVNVTELGEKLGIKVVGVSNVDEALGYMLGLRVERAPPNRPELPEGLRKSLSDWVDGYLRSAGDIRTEVQSKLDKLGTLSKRVVSNLLSDSENYSSTASNELAKGNYYTAASLAFNSVVQAEYARALLNYALQGESSVNEMMGRVDSKVKEVGAKVNATRPRDFSEVEALIAAKTRYYDARDALKRAAELIAKGSYFDSLDWGGIHWLAYAYWRADSAANWLAVQTQGERAEVDESRVREVASAVLYEAESVISYSESLLQEIGASSNFLNQANSYMNDASSAFSSKDYYGSIGLSASALAYGTASIHEWFTSDPNAVLKAVKEICYSSINDLLSRNVVPVLALSYAEMASTRERDGDKLSAIAYYELSSAHAHVISLLLRQSGSRVAEVTERIEGSEGTGTTSTAIVTQTVREVDSQRLTLYAGAAFVMGLMFGLILRRRS